MTQQELIDTIEDIDQQLATLVSSPEDAVDKKIGNYSEANSGKYKMLLRLREQYLKQLKSIPHEEIDYFNV